MKNKGSSLYEVLRSASRPQENPGSATPPSEPPSGSAEAGQSSLQERLAAYKAAKLAIATQPTASPAATAEATPPPAPTAPPVRAEVSAPALVMTPAVVAPPEPPGPAAEPAKGPGERLLRVTYNTIVFAALVAVGLFFIAYALGVKSGRSKAAEMTVETPRVSAPAPAPPAPPPAPAPAPRKDYTIRLAEWRYVKPSERGPADFEADGLKEALTRAGFKGVEKVKIERSGELRLALYVDRWSEVTSAAAKNRLATLQRFRYKNAAPLSHAVFEEVPR